MRSLTARLDHMRGEFAERVTHTFSEATGHADRLVQRLQSEVLRLDEGLTQRATASALADATAGTNSELAALILWSGVCVRVSDSTLDS